MEKFAVVTDVPLPEKEGSKEAAEKHVCKCGNDVDQHGRVNCCKSCGTKPFELPLTK